MNRRVWLLLTFAAALAGQEGLRLYARYCAHCHGADGEGARGPALVRTRLTRAASEAAFLRIVKEGIPDTEMPPSRLSDAEVRQIRAYLMALDQKRNETSRGDAVRGAALFLGKGGCVACHIVNGQGGRMGPELTFVGRSRSAARLRMAMLEPGAELPDSFAQYRLVIPMPDNFLMVRVRTKEGMLVTGIRLNEDPFTIQLRDLADQLHSFRKQDLVQMERLTGETPMPSYHGKLTEGELDDLVAYMLSLKGVAP
ncbi:MAG: c-type cytochrome [Acidimicrobiia bacterium]|nr:c-type cytochrome [Acidimicrobiia bacterium]